MAEDKIASTAEAVKGIVEAVPVYQDALQPAAREVGLALQTVAKTIHVVLAPVSALVWGYDKIRDYVVGAMEKRLKNLPPERLVPPPPTVAGPVLEALRFAGHEPTLREMYANLLATSLDSVTALDAHPAYVEIIRQLTPDEARIVSLFVSESSFPVITLRAKVKDDAGYFDVIRNFSLLPEMALCAHPALGQTYIDNICRLGLAEVPGGLQLMSAEEYVPLKEHPRIRSAEAEMANSHPDAVPDIELHLLRVTALGAQFCRACVATRTPE